MEKVEHYEVLARLQSPVVLYGAQIGRWFYIVDSPIALKYIQHWYLKCSNESPIDFTIMCQEEWEEKPARATASSRMVGNQLIQSRLRPNLKYFIPNLLSTFLPPLLQIFF